MTRERATDAEEEEVKEPLKAPFPYFGGKSKIASLVWSRLGNPDNYKDNAAKERLWCSPACLRQAGLFDTLEPV
jgi:hypothetical protein